MICCTCNSHKSTTRTFALRFFFEGEGPKKALGFTRRLRFRLGRLRVPGNELVLGKLFRYSILMLILPLSTLFVCLSMLEDHSYRDEISMGMSVVVANLVIASYAFMAFSEEVPEDPTGGESAETKKEK